MLEARLFDLDELPNYYVPQFVFFLSAKWNVGAMACQFLTPGIRLVSG